MLQRRIAKNLVPNADITLAMNGEEALDYVIKGKDDGDAQTDGGPTFHIIIMDQYMGDGGGVMLGTDTIIAMRREKVPSLIIGCSGNDLDDEFYRAGADLVWGKPMPSNDDIIRQFRKGLQDKILV
jgi:CheY-like chemotaxis protein